MIHWHSQLDGPICCHRRCRCRCRLAVWLFGCLWMFVYLRISLYFWKSFPWAENYFVLSMSTLIRLFQVVVHNCVRPTEYTIRLKHSFSIIIFWKEIYTNAECQQFYASENEIKVQKTNERTNEKIRKQQLCERNK